MRIKARTISRGYGEGEAIVSEKPVSFLGDIDPETGVVRDRESELYGRSVADKILVFPEGRGSTVGTYILLRMRKSGCAPAGIIMAESEAIIAVGAIIAGIPLVDLPEVNIFDVIETGDHVRIFADREGWIEVDKRR